MNLAPLVPAKAGTRRSRAKLELRIGFPLAQE